MSDRPLSIIVESFCYGSVDICGFDIHVTSKTYPVLVKALKNSDPSRKLETFWCLIRNVKHFETASIAYVNFIKDIFDILDERFGSSVSVSFNSPFVIKLYIINELFHSLTALNIEKKIPDIYSHFISTFNSILTFITDTDLTTFYNVPSTIGDSPWEPVWKIDWVDRPNSCLEAIKDTTIDIFTDNILSNPKIQAYENSFSAVVGDMIEKIAKRLAYLKRVAPEYFKFLDGIGVLTEFSHWVFHNFPYNEISNGYLDLVPLSDDIYLPPGVDRNLDIVDLAFEILPEDVCTHLLGFSHITGALSRKKIRQYAQQSKSDNYFKRIEEKNSKYIESIMFHEQKIGNLDEEGKHLNVLYMPVNSYSMDDISILYCIGTSA